MSNAGIEVDISKFNRMINHLQRLSNKPKTQVLKEESASVLRICIQQTKMASKAKLKKLNANAAHNKAGLNKRYQQSGSKVTWNDGSRGGKAGNAYAVFKGVDGKKRKVNLYQGYKKNRKKTIDIAHNKYVESPWERWEGTKFDSILRQAEADKSNLDELMGRIDYRKTQGLQVQGWLHIARALRVNVLQAPPKSAKIEKKVMMAKQATSAMGKKYVNGTAFVKQNSITLINKFPRANEAIYSKGKRTGNDIFRAALRRRSGAFKQAVKNDLFKDVKKAGFQFSSLN